MPVLFVVALFNFFIGGLSCLLGFHWRWKAQEEGPARQVWQCECGIVFTKENRPNA